MNPFEFRIDVESVVEAHGFQPCENESRQEAALAAVDNFADRIFFVTSVTWGRRSLFQSERAARLLLDTICSPIANAGSFELYEFVIMPDHIHLLLAPKAGVALERAMQFIKGGFSHRFMKETGSRMEIWQRSFTNHRIRDWTDFEKHRRYIHLNPVRAGLVEIPYGLSIFVRTSWSRASMRRHSG